MQKNRITGTAVVLILTLVFALILGACSGGDKETGNQGNGGAAGTDGDQAQASGKPVTLDVFLSLSPRIEDINKNAITQYIENKLNIKFKFDATPNANAADKKKLIMASGDYPSVFLSGDFTQSEQIDYGQQGVLLPLNDLIDQYGDEIKKAFQDDPDLKAAITAPDGNIYALPHVNDCFHCWYAQKAWINKTWLDKLGLEMPKTTEDFYDVLKAFKEKDPNGNGKADEIPYAGAIGTWHGVPSNFLMNAFIYDNDEDFFTMKDGKVDLAANKTEWRQGLEYLNKLYGEGLIDKESFTQNGDALTQVANKEGDNVLGAIAGGIPSLYFSLAADQTRHKDYVSIPPLTGPNGVAYTGYYKSYGNGQFAITNKASKAQQIAAIKMADYMWSEDHAITNEYGLEGKYWEKAPDGTSDVRGRQARYMLKPEFFDMASAATNNETWDQMGITRRTRDIRESWVAPKDPMSQEGYEYRLFLETQNNYENKQPKETFPLSIFMDTADAKEVNQLRPQINDYIRSYMAQFITGSKKLTDNEWNAYVKGFDGLKLKRYLEIYQNAYDKMAK
ncbi:type 2 periplasmic-binding domain-containing protein [Cohnella rhizosphaerae]|uniref:Extracellular solute-binding protein n=1 Tax=Cohnella rhizosphaerae TaxID=1457232 RepID=A0A9X4QRQ4_9BACL|nr:extracellular solute-binding protein [Cohnella rhizosphaerae]MDG0808825.1 extracellular solute-binding protein [Cohnella rhizosphaerae]